MNVSLRAYTRQWSLNQGSISEAQRRHEGVLVTNKLQLVGSNDISEYGRRNDLSAGACGGEILLDQDARSWGAIIFGDITVTDSEPINALRSPKSVVSVMTYDFGDLEVCS